MRAGPDARDAPDSPGSKLGALLVAPSPEQMSSELVSSLSSSLPQTASFCDVPDYRHDSSMDFLENPKRGFEKVQPELSLTQHTDVIRQRPKTVHAYDTEDELVWERGE
ncbi:hypothetical protein A6R68_11188, partial [Neotoma lepida]